MHNICQSLINIALRKVLKRLHYPLDSHACLGALVCGLSAELALH